MGRSVDESKFFNMSGMINLAEALRLAGPDPYLPYPYLSSSVASLITISIGMLYGRFASSGLLQSVLTERTQPYFNLPED